MKTRTAVVVVLVTAGVLALGFLAVIGLGRAAQSVRSRLASETARQQMVARWRPPAGLEPDQVFPPTIQGWTAGAPGNLPPPPDPALAFPGLRTVYSTTNGLEAIEVAVARPSSGETETIRQRFRDAFSRRTGSTTVVQINDRLRLASSQPPETVELWELRGWLFLFRSPADIPPEFIRDYLGAISAPAHP